MLGKLAHQIRKGTGVDIPVTALFTNTTVHAITSLINSMGHKNSFQNPAPKNDPPPMNAAGMYRRNQGEATLITEKRYLEKRTPPLYDEYSYPDDSRVHRENYRGQNHPLSLIIQAFPFVVFYPLKAAMTCTFYLNFLAYLNLHFDC